MRPERLQEALTGFSEVWAVDFEFNAKSGEHPVPICCVAKELRSGREQRRWGEELLTPIDIPASGVMVAYYASAEIGCYLTLGWPIPPAVLDLFAEFRVLTNGRGPAEGVAGSSLLDALSFFGLSALDPDEKTRWRERILAGPPYGAADREGILDYCRSDVLALEALIEPLVRRLRSRPHWEAHAILRGRAMVASARMEHTGIPLDTVTLRAMSGSWSTIQGRLIASAQAGYPFYEDGSLKLAKLEVWVAEQGIVWPRTEAGRLSLSEETLRILSRAHPQLAAFRELRSNLSKLQVSRIAVGRDGRNRTLLSPFRARTGRNQPSGSQFIFAPSVWIRHLIKPPPDRALAYIDFASQEIGIAAALSGDPVMQRAYISGDPYLSFAMDAGLAPPEATKDSHKAVRERCKALVLGTLYGMGEATLASQLAIPVLEARRLLEAHKRTYGVFWDWIRRVADSAILRGYIDSVYGWRRHITADTRPTSLLNHPMQSHGAEILRLACCFLTEAGFSVCAPVHDAVLIEMDDTATEAVVADARALMTRASRIVLGGFEIRTDAKIIRHPDRFEDPRGTEMWKKVNAILADIQGSSGEGEGDSENWPKSVVGTNALQRRSHAQIGTPGPIPFSL